MPWSATVPTRPITKGGWSGVLPTPPPALRTHGWKGWKRRQYRPIGLSGHGSLTAHAFGVHSIQSVNLSGEGDLSADIMVKRFRDADLSGGGALSAAALGPVFVSVEFTSEGILSSVATGPRYITVDFGGDGSLDSTVQAPVFIEVLLGGQGLLGADSTATEVQPLPDGLSATVSQVYYVLAQFAASGQLTVALSEIEFALGPNFTAAGELSAIISKREFRAVDLSGEAQLTAIAGHLAALAGSGTLTAQAQELLRALRDAALSSTGTVAGTAHEDYLPTAAAGGVGSMTATAFERYLIPANLSGAGGLSASAVQQVAFNVTAGFDYNSNAKTDSQSVTLNGVRAGDYVLVFTSGDDTTSPTMRYAGSNMTQLARLPYNNNSGQAELQCYGIKDNTGGNRSIDWTGNAPGSVILGAVAYSGEVSVGAVETSYGTGGTAAQSQSCGPGEVIVQAFGASSATWTAGGGNVRSNASDSNNVPLLVMDQIGAANFSASGSIGNWAGISVVLSPT